MSEDMKLIVDIDDNLHRKLKIKAARDGTTIKQIVTKAIEKVV